MRTNRGAVAALVLALGLGAAGCSDEEDPKLTVSSNYSQPSQIYVDGSYVGTVPAGGVATWEIDDGSSSISADTSSTTIDGDIGRSQDVGATVNGSGDLVQD